MSMQGLGVLPSAAADTVKTSVEPSQQSKREDWRKAKELEEARKAGTAPALRDEEGRDINPHIPQYISTVPWYVGYNQPTLKHQRPQFEKQKEFSQITSWYKKGVREGSTSTKFRKGACENCGAMTHKKKDCVERPRKVGAKFTGEQFAPDEHLQPNLDFDYDGKRDRWNGYNPEEYEAVLDEYAKIEEAKKQLKAKELQDLASGELTTGKLEGAVDSDNSDADDDKYADDFDMPGTNFDSKRRITVRNLRIREDTAKYLYSLDPNSAYYDPKTRSMRQNPFKDKMGDESKIAGDNFVRATGDTKEMATAQLFAWEASEKGTDVHLQADPTKLELLHKEFTVKKDDFKTNQKGSILERYGGAEHLEAPPKELLLAQTEDYVEYSRHGNIIKGQERAKAKSKYQEDVFSNNHMSIWGSYWRDFYWGYSCCHSTVRGSYCTGQAGKQASIADNIQPMEEAEGENQEEPKSLMEQHKDKLEKERRKKEKRSKKKKKNKRKKKQHQSSSDDSESDSGEDEEEIKRKKLQEALRKEAESQREAERILATDERKRPYNSLRAMETKEPTEEEMEAFRMKRKRFEDPMSHF